MYKYIMGLINRYRNVTADNLSNITDVQIEGINTRDYPDFVDAYITSATWKNSLTELTEKQLDQLNTHADYVHGQVFDYLY